MFEDSIEARAKTTFEAVDELLSATPELQEVYRRSKSLLKEEELSELLRHVVDQRRSLIKDSVDKKRRLLGAVSEEEAEKAAKKYLEMPWAHTAWVTNYLAANLMAATIIEGQHRLGWGKRFVNLFPNPLNWIARAVVALISICILVCLIILSIFLFDEDRPVLGSLVVAFTLWRYIGGLVAKTKRRSFFLRLILIAEQINSGRYDRQESSVKLTTTASSSLCLALCIHCSDSPSPQWPHLWQSEHAWSQCVSQCAV